MQLSDDYIYSDTLMHGHKYIDKYRSKNTGKWIYVYTKSGYTTHSKDPKTGTETTVHVPETKVYTRNGDKLLSSKKTQIATSPNGGSIRNEYREVGKIDRAARKAADTIGKTSSNVARKVKDLSDSTVKRGKEFIDRLFK